MIGLVITRGRLSSLLLAATLSLVLLTLVIFKGGSSAHAKELCPVRDTTERIAYIENLGYKVDTAAPEEKKQTELPNIFTPVYEEYERLQQKAELSLKPYAGKGVELYTYKLIFSGRDDVYAHLITLDGYLLGGDVSALSLEDGFMLPLIPT